MNSHPSHTSFPVLVDLIWKDPAGPQALTHSFVRSTVLAVLGSLFLALTAQISIPFYPVPITGQTFGVLLIGLTFGWKLAGGTVLLYLFEGAMGLPFFSAGGGSLAHFLKPSAGYLIGFLPAAMACGWFAEKGFDRKFISVAIALLVGNFIIFAFGLTWLSIYLGWGEPILALGLFPFIPGLLIKTALIVVLLPSTWKAVQKFKYPK